jgi:hypothetical protein
MHNHILEGGIGGLVDNFGVEKVIIFTLSHVHIFLFH